MNATRLTLWQWLALALAVLALNAALTFHSVWPTLFVETRFEPSIELAVLLLALVGYAAWLRPPGKGMRTGLTMLFVLLVLGRYAVVTAPALYGRPVNAYWDGQHLPNVAAMLVEVAPWWLVLALVLGVIAVLAALALVLRICIACVLCSVQAPAARRVLGLVAGVVVAVYVAARIFDWPVQHRFTVPVTAAYAQQGRFLYDAFSGTAARELPIAPLATSNLGRLAGTDVLLLFLESYGAVTYDRPEVAAVVTPARAELWRAATRTGRRVLSAFYESSTFGGGSWLAHSSFMSGLEVREPGEYERLLTQQRETLPKRFKVAGYRAVAAMPGLKLAWPEGAFYGFDAILGEREIDYRGPDFGWWRIPDQYTLAKLEALERPAGARAPLFAFLPTINTHIPFLPIPPYQSQWQRLLSAEPFDATDVAASVARAPDWLELGAPYADSFAYTFNYLAGYLRERPDDDALLLLIGDHQPAASVTGPGARWDVPVHVITRRDDIASALLAAGFVEGVSLSPDGAPLGTLPDLTTLLLKTLDSP